MPPIEILYDGDTVIAVNKPAGLSTQAPAGIDSLESRIQAQLASRTEYIAFPHRLDRPVSGVILIAMTKRVARLLSDQFASRKVHKTYLAWVAGKIGDVPSRWEDWLRKIPDQPRGEICDQADEGAKLAQTGVECVRYDAARDSSLLKLSPVTGRMHQLRIQSAVRGHGILGDGLYGSLDKGSESGQRIWLHASSITFHDPKNGRKTNVECPDDDFPQAV